MTEKLLTGTLSLNTTNLCILAEIVLLPDDLLYLPVNSPNHRTHAWHSIISVCFDKLLSVDDKPILLY